MGRGSSLLGWVRLRLARGLVALPWLTAFAATTVVLEARVFTLGVYS